MLKRRLCVVLACAALGARLVWAQTAPVSPERSLPTARIRLPDGFAVTAELALTPQTQEKGLMYRTEMTEDHGMLFVFKKQGWVQFWMKNTWMDLDMVFLDRNRKVTRVYHRVPRSYPGWTDDRVARVPGFCLYVLELASGTAGKHRLKAGAKLGFVLPKGYSL